MSVGIGHIDHAALAPAYAAAGTALLVFLADLFIAPTWRRRGILLLSLSGLGIVVTGLTAFLISGGSGRSSFCIPAGTLPGDGTANLTIPSSCSYGTNSAVIAWIIGLCIATLVVLLLSKPALPRQWGRKYGQGIAQDPNQGSSKSGMPQGEYCFLLLCSLTGAVVLVGARDLITLIVSLEALTLPLYVLVGAWSSSKVRRTRCNELFP